LNWADFWIKCMHNDVPHARALRKGPKTKAAGADRLGEGVMIAKYLVRDCSEGGADMSSAPVEVCAHDALEAAKKVVDPSILLRAAGQPRELCARVRDVANPGEETLFYGDPNS
jgi:hypothetical protein